MASTNNTHLHSASTSNRPTVHASTLLHKSTTVVDNGSRGEEPFSTTHSDPSPADILVVGASVVDLIGTLSVSTQLKSSNPGRVQTSNGGVGRNIAQSLAALGVRVKLGSVVADDSNGRKSSDQQHRTAVYSAIHDESGDLLVGVADTAIMHQLDGRYVDILADHLTSISAIKLLVLDGNLSTDAFTSLVSTASRRGVSLFFEPTSSHKCLLPLLAGCFHQVRIVPHITTLTIASWP